MPQDGVDDRYLVGPQHASRHEEAELTCTVTVLLHPPVASRCSAAAQHKPVRGTVDPVRTGTTHPARATMMHRPRDTPLEVSDVTAAARAASEVADDDLLRHFSAEPAHSGTTVTRSSTVYATVLHDAHATIERIDVDRNSSISRRFLAQ